MDRILDISVVLSILGLVVGLVGLGLTIWEIWNRRKLADPPIHELDRLKGELAKELTAEHHQDPDILSRVSAAIDELKAEIRGQLADRLSYAPDDAVVEQTTIQVLARNRSRVRSRLSQWMAGSDEGSADHLLEDADIRDAVKHAAKRTVRSLSAQRVTVLVKMTITCIISSLLVFFIPRGLDARPLHAKLTDRALRAFEKEDWEEAMELAQKCIEDFESAAVTKRKELDEEGYELVSRDLTDEDEEKSFENGPLNDVAASYLVLGRVHEKQWRRDKTEEAYKEAYKAYTEAAKFPRSAKWDPKGWFWFPGKDAASRLELLDEETSETLPDSSPTSEGPSGEA